MVPYASVINNLMYVQVCTRLNIALVVSVLRRYLSDLGQRYWTVAKKVMKYFQGTKNYMLTYRWSSDLTCTSYLDSDFTGCPNDKKSTTRYVFKLTGGVVS